MCTHFIESSNFDQQAREATDENAPRSKKQKLIFSEIKCICLNVCGIKSKLVLPEFIIQLITTHDICIFIVTKTDKYDILNIPDGMILSNITPLFYIEVYTIYQASRLINHVYMYICM
jgi:hypothetical protein